MRDQKTIELPSVVVDAVSDALAVEFGNQVWLTIAMGRDYVVESLEPSLQLAAYWFCIGFIAARC